MREVNFGVLKLKNFKGYQDEITIDFNPNRLILLVGSNGAGKTTLAVDAICWALYGVTSEGMKGDSIVNKRAKKNTEVHIDWTIGEDQYAVSAYRKHNKFANKRILFKNGIAISGGKDTGDVSKETLDKIKDVLMPKDVFLNCLLFSKFVKKSFSRSGTAERQDIIDDVLSLSWYNRYQEVVKNKTKEYRIQIKELENNKLNLENNLRTNTELLRMEINSSDNLVMRYEENTLARNNEIERLRLEIPSLQQIVSEEDEVKALEESMRLKIHEYEKK
jgi:DNA repair exonuclease SbcCD ATPase subunit